MQQEISEFEMKFEKGKPAFKYPNTELLKIAKNTQVGLSVPWNVNEIIFVEINLNAYWQPQRYSPLFLDSLYSSQTRSRQSSPRTYTDDNLLWAATALPG